ncbi:glycine--tRNA ligase [Candidatus Woesearchaeota archaeon]|nr:glycine--tRNA ligase [Candidatus Woesearchaeota archaeon]
MAFTIEQMAVFCKKKGFVYQDSEIYGTMAGFWDFGPLGVELKNNIKHEWWKYFVHSTPNVTGMDGSIITNKRIWEASGHAEGFSDVLIECKKCNSRLRADHVIEDALKIPTESMSLEDIERVIKKEKLKCPKCAGEFGKPKAFNLMFKTNVGPVSDKSNEAFLRPETAQLIFADYKLVVDNSRLKLPFGIAQVGKSFRNEISPRDFLFRSREFEQMEIEFFSHPDKINECAEFDRVKEAKLNVLSADMQKKDCKHKKVKLKTIVDNKSASKWHAYWIYKCYQWFIGLGISEDNLRIREHLDNELAHYAGACFDIEYNYSFGWKELTGNADRKQFDLTQHTKFSKKDLSIYDEETKSKVIPYVASEPSFGVDRTFLTFLFEAYEDDKKRGNIVLRLHPKLAPVKAAILPLVNKDKIPDMSIEIFNDLIKEHHVAFDKSGSIGRRYARNDEIGTPYCITVDFDSLKAKDVTIRDRDTTKQIRVKIKDLREVFRKLVNGEIEFEKAGKSLK